MAVLHSIAAPLHICTIAALAVQTSARAWCSNSAEFDTEQTGSRTPKQQHNIWLFGDASTQHLKKETNPSTYSKLSVGKTLHCITLTEVGNFHGNSSVLQLQLPGRAALCQTQNTACGHASSGILALKWGVIRCFAGASWRSRKHLYIRCAWSQCPSVLPAI